MRFTRQRVYRLTCCQSKNSRSADAPSPWLSASLQMQGCCPHRESPSSPRKLAAGILGTKFIPRNGLRFRDQNTGRPCKLFVCDHDCFEQKLYRARLPCVLLFTIAGFWVGDLVADGVGRFEESSSPL